MLPQILREIEERKEELLAQKDGFAELFHAAKKTIGERKEAIAAATEALEEAEKGQKEACRAARLGWPWGPRAERQFYYSYKISPSRWSRTCPMPGISLLSDKRCFS